MLLTGLFTRSIDQKLRLAIPKRLREALVPQTAKSVVYLAPGTDQSLSLYSEDAFAKLAERLDQASPTRQDVRAFNRLFYARAQRLDIDAQGRIRIPPDLAQFAKLQKEVVLLGVQDHAEVWATEQWHSYLAEKQEHYDEISETAFHD